MLWRNFIIKNSLKVIGANLCMKRLILICIAATCFAAGSYALSISMSDKDALERQLEISDRVTEYLGDLFQKFSDGYIESQDALEKVSLLTNYYNNSIQPVPEEAIKLHELMKRFLSHAENYFIYFKQANRENPEINEKIAEFRYEIVKEVMRLNYLMESL